MDKRTKLSVNDKEWIKLQGKIQDKIDEQCGEISDLFKTFGANEVFVTYFLMFWTRVLKFTERQDSGYSNQEVIDTIKKMMGGDLPGKMDIDEHRTLN